jgi:hypothetical protein
VSDQPGTPGQPGQGGEPSEEEVRAYLGQLRGAPVEQVVAEVISAMLNAAQVKLGRKDGRLLLDLATSTVEGARAHLPSELTDQVDDVLAQLRVAQVDAEREVAEAAQQGHHEEGDLTAGGPGPAAEAGADPASSPPPEAPPSAASRLWVPGR